MQPSSGEVRCCTHSLLRVNALTCLTAVPLCVNSRVTLTVVGGGGIALPPLYRKPSKPLRPRPGSPSGGGTAGHSPPPRPAADATHEHAGNSGASAEQARPKRPLFLGMLIGVINKQIPIVSKDSISVFVRYALRACANRCALVAIASLALRCVPSPSHMCPVSTSLMGAYTD